MVIIRIEPGKHHHVKEIVDKKLHERYLFMVYYKEQEHQPCYLIGHHYLADSGLPPLKKDYQNLIRSGSAIIALSKERYKECRANPYILKLEDCIKGMDDQIYGTLGGIMYKSDGSENDMYGISSGHIFLSDDVQFAEPQKFNHEHVVSEYSFVDNTEKRTSSICSIGDEYYALMNNSKDNAYIDVAVIPFSEELKGIQMFDSTIPNDATVFEKSDKHLRAVGSVYKEGANTGIRIGSILETNSVWVINHTKNDGTTEKRVHFGMFIIECSQKQFNEFSKSGDSGSFVIQLNSGCVLGVVSSANEEYEKEVVIDGRVQYEKVSAVACIRLDKTLQAVSDAFSVNLQFGKPEQKLPTEVKEAMVSTILNWNHII